jgi:hypothetical protein
MIYKRKPPPDNVRRVTHIRSNICGITTNKRGRLVQFESEQERKLILLLERDGTVSDYISQPETLKFVGENNSPRQYTPDFQVWRTNGQVELHEVTVAQRRQTNERAQQREAAARQICQQRGWIYHVHTEETLPSGYEYANLDTLATFRADSYDDEAISAWWVAQLHRQGRVHPRDVLTRAPAAYASGQLLNTLYHLLWHNRLQMAWAAPFIWRGAFHPDARIWLSEEAGQLSGSMAVPTPGERR